MYSGALERHPALQLVFTEQGTSWIPETLGTLDYFFTRMGSSGGSQEQPDIPPEEERKIGDTAGRIKRGKRMIFEISPDEVGMVQDVREA